MADQVIEQPKSLDEYRVVREALEAPSNGEELSEVPAKVEPEPVVTPEAAKPTQETEEEKEAKRNTAFAKLRTDHKAEKDRADRLERELQEARTRKPDEKPDQPKAPVNIDDPKPTMKQFLAEAKDGETFAEVTERFTDAMGDWRDRQRDKAAKEAEATNLQQTAKQAFEAKLATVRALHDDFDEVTRYDPATKQGLALTPVMQKFAVQHAQGVDVIYDLAKNPAEYKRIFAIEDADEQRDELRDIAKRLKTPEPEKPKIPVSKIPPPPSRVGGTETPQPKTAAEAAAGGLADYRKFREANGRR